MRRVVVGTVFFVVLMSGTGLASDTASLLRPQLSGDFGFWNGNEIMGQPALYRAGYFAGVVDALMAAMGEYAALADSTSAPAGASLLSHRIDDETWRNASVEIRQLVAADLLLKRLVVINVLIPEGVTTDQVVDLAEQYLREHPTERHNNAALLLWRALADAAFKWR